MQQATDLQDLDHLIQVDAFSERLHVDLFLFVVIAEVFVLDAHTHALATHLAEPSPELNKRVLTQHLIEGCARVCPALPLPFVVFTFELIHIETKLGCRKR